MPVDADQRTSAPASADPAPASTDPASSPGRGLLLPIGVIVLFLIAMLAAAVAGHPTFNPTGAAPTLPPMPTEQQTLPPLEGGEPEDNGDGVFGIVLSILLLLFVLAVVVTALVLFIRAFLVWWSERPLRRREAASADVEALAGIVADAEPDPTTVRRGIAAARAAIGTTLDPADAIIAAWVGLEETAAESGVGRGRSETPSEFTLRILLRRPGIETATRDLLRLYEGVRFGGHPVDEQMRAAAARALAEIEEGWR